jgi:uncharacterized membrane protein YfcA
MGRGRLLKLAAIATAAGAFSGMFGVGGGSVIVPLLIFWLAYNERAAAGTSLAAIVVIAVFAVAAQGGYGNVDVAEGLVIGVPAAAGAVAGASLQQRVSEPTISALFALLLLAVAVQLVVG